MAERGGPEEEIEAAETSGPTGGFGAAVAMALGRRRVTSKTDPELDAFLREQTRLARLQSEHLHEQRELQLAHLRVRRWRDRVSLALQCLGLVVGAAAVIGLGVMVWQAHEDQGLVVEPFAVPPDLAARGVTGEVVAAKLLDRLAALQAQTDSQRAPDTLANNWGDDIKLAIPETGVSIGDLNRYLRQWLGHQTRVSGELLHTQAGLSLTTRAEGSAGQTVEGVETDLDGLAQRAAESVYGETQPYRYGVYLRGQGRLEEALDVYAKLTTSGPRSERAWGYLGLANSQRDLKGPKIALATMREAASLSPRMFLPWQNIGDIESDDLGLAEAGFVDHRAAVKLLDGPDHGGVRADMATNARQRMLSFIDAETGDYASAIRRREGVVAFGRQGLLGSASALLVDAEVSDHDLAAAKAALNPSDMNTISPGRATFDNIRAAMEIDAAEANWPGVFAAQAQAQAILPRWPGIAYSYSTQLTPIAAEAKAAMGDLPGAQALIATTPLDCYNCLRTRGRIAAAARDWPAAQRWFAEAARRAPSIPFAYADWGRMLLAKGDVDGAIAKLEIARQKGPHYADVLELWGEALMRKGDFAGAAAKFAAAAGFAPRWTLNQTMWRQAEARVRGHG